MKQEIQVVAVALLIVCLVFAYIVIARGSERKSKVLPPPRSKSTELTYQESNSIAKLFLETVSLRESEASWPIVLKGLNKDDEPRVRTLLLELRSFDTSSPNKILVAIESVCIVSKRERQQFTRVELLERALAHMKKPQLN
jgi:hypothetical protein